MWGEKKKGHWAFLESSSKARLCVYRLGKGWAQASGACTLLQRCLVIHYPPTHTLTRTHAQLG